MSLPARTLLTHETYRRSRFCVIFLLVVRYFQRVHCLLNINAKCTHKILYIGYSGFFLGPFLCKGKSQTLLISPSYPSLYPSSLACFTLFSNATHILTESPSFFNSKPPSASVLIRLRVPIHPFEQSGSLNPIESFVVSGLNELRNELRSSSAISAGQRRLIV